MSCNCSNASVCNQRGCKGCRCWWATTSASVSSNTGTFSNWVAHWCCNLLWRVSSTECSCAGVADARVVQVYYRTLPVKACCACSSMAQQRDQQCMQAGVCGATARSKHAHLRSKLLLRCCAKSCHHLSTQGRQVPVYRLSSACRSRCLM